MGVEITPLGEPVKIFDRFNRLKHSTLLEKIYE
jgi:hypothetical protein